MATINAVFSFQSLDKIFHMKRILIIAGIFFVLGCNKESEVTIPFIEINLPTNNQHFVKGDTIHISGFVTHDKALTEISVHMINLSTNTEFFHNHFSAGNQLVFNYYSNYPITDNSTSSFKLEVEATDKEGVTASEEMMILIN